MEISRLSVRDFTEESVTHHAQDHHLAGAITAIFQKDAVLASGFGGIDQVPALFECRTGGHFDGSVLAILHGAEGHGDVPVPRGGYVDHIEFELGQVLEIPFALAEAGGLCLACVRDRFLSARDFFRHKIADCLDLNLFNGEQIL